MISEKSRKRYQLASQGFITTQERAAAQKLFGSEKGMKAIKEEEQAAEQEQNVEQMKAIKQAIESAKSLDEVAQLERALAAGQIPQQSNNG